MSDTEPQGVPHGTATQGTPERRRTDVGSGEQAPQADVILDSISDGFLALDHDWQFTYLNLAASRLMGPKEEILGRNQWELYPDTLGTPVETNYRRSVAEQVAVEFENYYEPWGRWFLIRAHPWRGGLAVSFRDVTEERRLREERDEALAMLDALIRSAPLGIATLDSELRFRLVNSPLAEMNGIPAEEHIGRSVAEVVPSLVAAAEPVVRDVFANRRAYTAYEIEGETPKEPGVVRTWEESWFPVLDGKGRVRVAGVIVQEVTERKRVEEALRRSERQAKQSLDLLYAIVEQCPFGIYIVDADFRVATMNKGSQDGAFANVRPVIGRPFEEAMRILWPEPVAADIIASFRRTLDTGDPYYSKDFVSQRADEDRVEGYEWELHRVTMPDGLPGVACYYFDSTRLKLAEAALRDNDRRKNEFLAMLAHELRNPLSAIHSAVKVAQVPNVGEHLPQTLEIIDRQARNLARLIDDLLDVSRITQGKVDLKRETIDVVAIINRAAQAVKTLVDQKQHKLTFEHDFGPLRVDADPTRLEQIIGNLLTNAAKYTEPGGRISISAHGEGGDAVIRVRDTGVGISPEMLPEVFELFTQVDRSLARSEGGLGIGLSLVRRLVEMHGGTVAATSEVGRGSEFTVELPLVEGGFVEDQPGRTEMASGAGKRVLIVDDNVDTARLTSRLLRLLGYEVEIAHDGEESIDVARSLHPEVVLLDIGLPGMDGFEVARRLRREECCRDSLIIGVSGYGDAESREKSREAGFDHHLVKPVAVELLTTFIERAASRSG